MVTITTLAIGAHGGFVLEPAARELRKEGHEITLFCEDSTNLDEELELIPGFLDKVRKSDLLFLNVHGDVTYFRHFDSLKSLMDSSDISVLLYGCEEGVVLSYRKYFRGSDEDYTKLLTLESIGGDDNHRAALLWALKHFDGADVEIPEPVLPLAQGVYVPGIGGIPLEEGLRDVGSTGKPVVGIFFVNSFFVRSNLLAIDYLYKAVEEAGAEPLALFFHSYENANTGSIGISRIVDEYLVRDGKPIMDAALIIFLSLKNGEENKCHCNKNKSIN